MAMGDRNVSKGFSFVTTSTRLRVTLPCWFVALRQCARGGAALEALRMLRSVSSLSRLHATQTELVRAPALNRPSAWRGHRQQAGRPSGRKS